MDKHKRITTTLLIIVSFIAIALYYSYSTKDMELKFDSKLHKEFQEPNEEKEIILDVSKIEELPTQEEMKILKMSRKQEITYETAENVPTPRKELIETSSGGTDLSESRAHNYSGYLNDYVLSVINSYKIGNYPYLLNNDYENYNGVTEDLYYKGEILLKANPNGNKASHCTGITFEVFFKAMQNRNKDLGLDPDNFNGMNKDMLMDFVLHWYVANGPKAQSNLAVALEKYGIGIKVNNMEELRAGDFIDFSRENNTGHSVVFINWIKEESKIIGFKYWSSQESTKGISYKEEYFNIKNSKGSKYGNVIFDNLYMAKVLPVNQYK